MSELYAKFGELLKLERKRKTLKLEDLSDQLKITVENLEHIEEGEVGELPSTIYFNLFAKAYAETLGIDFDRTMEAIKEDLGEPVDVDDSSRPSKPGPPKKKGARKSDVEEEQEPVSENARSIKKLIYMFAGIVVVFVLFLVIYNIFWGPGQLKEQSQTVAVEEREERADEETRQTDTSELTGYDWDTPEYRKPEKIILRLMPRNESWSTVLADGDTAIFRNLIPGRVYMAEADYRLTVSIGIPSQVQAELNGVEVNLADPQTGRVSKVEINQVNLQQFLSPESDDTETQEVSPQSEPATTPPLNTPPVETVDSAVLPTGNEDVSDEN